MVLNRVLIVLNLHILAQALQILSDILNKSQFYREG
jgi:hypothetical protein